MFNVKEIKYGDKGNEVKFMQILLRGRDYKAISGRRLHKDGVFDENSYHALKNFQKNNGLVQDGVCGSNTWEELIGVR